MNVLPVMKDWYDREIREPEQRLAKARMKVIQERDAEKRKGTLVRTTTNAEEKRGFESLGSVTFPVGSFDKRFYRSLAKASQLTDAQRSCLWRIVWRYRRQVKDTEITGIAKSYVDKETA